MENLRDKVLLVDDERNALLVYAGLLKEWGLEAVTASGTLEAMQLVRSGAGIDLALVDLRMPPPDGMALFRWLRAEHPDVPVIILTAYGSIGSAVEAMSEGAFHYLAKPPEPEQLRSIIEKAMNHVRMTREIRLLRERLEEKDRPGDELVGRSPSFARALELAGSVAASEAPVLLSGETGTGKEVVARFLHRRSRRRSGPFVGLNCGALPPALLESELFGHEKGAFTGALSARQGRFEEADGGTIFLDEVGDCSPELQVKLLRVLQEKEFSRVGSNRRLRSDFRLLAASNRDLGRAVREGKFREDLFFRVNVFEIRLPSLRERMEDVPALAMHFLRRNAAREGRTVDGLSPAALEMLMEYDWPGNVRELENAIYRAVVIAEGPMLKPEHLPPNLRHREGAVTAYPPGQVFEGQTLSDFERMVVRTTLARCNGNKSRAARMLGISRKVLYSKIVQHGLAE